MKKASRIVLVLESVLQSVFHNVFHNAAQGASDRVGAETYSAE